ncbi:hypothetical protein ABT390_32445 [Streptomyces aurantiacus]|uniref:Uncharacterized protein n=1 Tax=Streptomyces aurantiacus JA 4570 TaxID=1286094 RepID=S3ZHN6_9ACTN|nr:hypothetical protein [Streptomyces aurantiacus]EPH43106.1 hypothetical protein STRAU_3845 [Streptomyces aurantiacus JA 4570]
MKIDWAALGSVFGVSLAVTVALVGLFTLGIVGLSKQEQAREARAAGGATAALPARVGAYACFALCAAAVAYGISLIVV